MTSQLMRHVQTCQSHDPASFYPFIVEGRTIGEIAKLHADIVLGNGGFVLAGETIGFSDQTPTYDARTRALAEVAVKLSQHYGVKLTGEIYPVVEEWAAKPVAEIDRAAIPWFGTCGFGVHANGFVRKPRGIHLWVATRAKSRKIDPGKRDNMIGGGLPMGYSIIDNLAKEAAEEAGLDSRMMAYASAHGHLHYKRDMMHGVRHDGLFLFDLEMDDEMLPHNTDGEVERFDLLPAQEVLDIITKTDDFKFNCNLVMIDFFLRHGILGPEHPEYEALTAAFAKLKA